LLQLWKEILKSHPYPAFSQKAVYDLWFKQRQTHWRRHNDDLESAKILLKEFSQANSAYKIEPIPVPQNQDDGFTAIAFALPTLIRKWGGKIREVALDSTCMFSNLIFDPY
jgi:hypothetical protein